MLSLLSESSQSDYCKKEGPQMYVALLLRLSQTYYVQVSTWMIRMESQLIGSGRDSREAYKTDINSRASLFVQVCM